MYWMNYGWGMGLGWLFMVLFWGLVALGVIYLVKAVSGAGGKRAPEDSPLDILKKRYARGELTGEEFEKMKQDLRKD